MLLLTIFFTVGSMTDFVPNFIGLGHVSRENVMKNHTSVFVIIIFGNDRDDVTV